MLFLLQACASLYLMCCDLLFLPANKTITASISASGFKSPLFAQTMAELSPPLISFGKGELSSVGDFTHPCVLSHEWLTVLLANLS